MPEQPTDRIRLTGISATGYHGVFEHERREGQRFVADVVLHVDTRAAAAHDDLALTADYGSVASAVRAVLTGEPADLIETVAERIAAAALAHQAVQAVDVVVHKPDAPVGVPLVDVTVEVHRSRSHLPVVDAVGDVGAPVAVPFAPPADAGAPVPVPDIAPPAPEPALPDPAELDGVTGDGRLGELPWAADDVLSPADAARDGRRDRLDDPPSAPVDVVLALGSNLGSSQDILRAAVAELAALPGFEVVRVAPLARTAAVGGPEQPDFLNTVVLGRTVLSPRALLAACHEIEAAFGRERHERWGARTLDIDIIVVGSVLAVTEDLELPHPRAHQRAFVLEPWAQVDPHAVLPGLGGGPVAVLAGTAPDRDGIRWLALDWWAVPEE